MRPRSSPFATCGRSTDWVSRSTCCAEDFVDETVKAHLNEKGMTMRQGTIFAASLIAAPSSTKNKEGKRDPEMHQTKKGNQWSHRYKDSWLIHSVVVTAANVHDITPAAELLHGDEEVVDGDAGYQASQKGLKWQARQRNSGWRCDPGQAQGLTRHTRRPGCAAWPYRGQRPSVAEPLEPLQAQRACCAVELVSCASPIAYERLTKAWCA